MASPTSQADLQRTRYRTATVNGRKVFYREAGDPHFSHHCSTAWTSDEQPNVSRADSCSRLTNST